MCSIVLSILLCGSWKLVNGFGSLLLVVVVDCGFIHRVLNLFWVGWSTIHNICLFVLLLEASMH